MSIFLTKINPPIAASSPAGGSVRTIAPPVASASTTRSAAVTVSDAVTVRGLQIVAPMWEDGTSIEFAGLLMEIVGGFTAPEGLTG